MNQTIVFLPFKKGGKMHAAYFLAIATNCARLAEEVALATESEGVWECNLFPSKRSGNTNFPSPMAVLLLKKEMRTIAELRVTDVFGQYFIVVKKNEHLSVDVKKATSMITDRLSSKGP